MAPEDAVSSPAGRRRQRGHRHAPARGGHASSAMAATELTLPHTVLEGHRFVLEPIAAGERPAVVGPAVRHALRDMAPGEYACNERILAALAERDIDFELPPRPTSSTGSSATSSTRPPSCPVARSSRSRAPGTFAGFRRPGDARRGHPQLHRRAGHDLARERASPRARRRGSIARLPLREPRWRRRGHAHRGRRPSVPHNLEFVLRTLAGFMVHPNVGAVLAVDYPGAGYGNAELRRYVSAHGYPLADVPPRVPDHRRRASRPSCERAERVVRELAPGGHRVDAHRRAALGAQGRAAVRWLGRLLGGLGQRAGRLGRQAAHPPRRQRQPRRDRRAHRRRVATCSGTCATSRRLGASSSASRPSRSASRTTAPRPRAIPPAATTTAGSTTSPLKSIGAARKFDPEVRLDHVIDYGEPMTEPGYYFMDSPGNDLESIAGQVAAGCNLIFFTTGNGSITNFPFVPTLKFVTTTRPLPDAGRRDGRQRRPLQRRRVDGGAGRRDLRRWLGRSRRASAARASAPATARSSCGATGSRSTTASSTTCASRPFPTVRPLATRPRGASTAPLRGPATPTRASPADQVALVMPTSLCSGQVARLIAERLNARLAADAPSDALRLARAHRGLRLDQH